MRYLSVRRLPRAPSARSIPVVAPRPWRARTLLLTLAIAGAGASEGAAQQGSSAERQVAVEAPATRPEVPFSAGEQLSYEVRFGALKVGSGRMEVLGITTIRGREAWHTRFTVKGGVPLYRVNDRMESWMDTRTLHSLRFVQDLEEGGKDRERGFEIYPDRRTFVEHGDTTQHASVSDPLDDGAFLYFVRTIPLEIGKTYTFQRYFRPDRNPVTIRVLRREKVKVPAGTFETIVIQPTIKTRGIFSEKGHAELWLTDDDRRMMVQMKSKLSFGSLNLYLTGATPGGSPAAPTP
jgi:hypothetical protein